MRHGMPFSMRAIVMGDTFAFLASSVLLISNDSLIFFKAFFFIQKTRVKLAQSRTMKNKKWDNKIFQVDAVLPIIVIESRTFMHNYR